MKYGQHLRENIAPEYGPDPYLDYARLDDIIRVLSGKAPASVDQKIREVSLTTPPPTNAQGRPQLQSTITEEEFYSLMDKEMAKVESFTLSQVTELRTKIDTVEISLQDIDITNEDETEELLKVTDDIAESFLTLEKYVNINFMGFHKILKKHDKHVPANPCRSFYVSRMHAQAWVRGDYSDVVVRLSSIYSTLRNDHAVEESADASQSFLRSTTKYWVKTEDVSRVKYAILRHLPVFLQKTSTGESDSQLTNSVYLDNAQLELYHGRLDKTPGAIALRLRWYGAADPRIVFVERKTHRDKWTGEVSVKERFMIQEEEVQHVMNNTYPIEDIKLDMIENKGSSQTDADEWENLASEITQVISSKQLVPTMRTQYMRTAFQIPFDATVRVSLDTNLCMISERGYDLKNNTIWHRDSSKTIATNEITRFPHAVLEIKLELKGADATPPRWVQDLQNSGMLYEVHKFSKFIHGCAVLMPEDVRSVPYWVDDASLRDSIIASGGGRILVRSDTEGDEDKGKKKGKGGVGPGANQVYDHLLPFGDVTDNRTGTAEGRTAGRMPSQEQAVKTTTKKPRSAAQTKPEVGNYGVNFYNDADVDDVELLDRASPSDNDCCGGDEGCVGWLFPFCSPFNNEHYDAVVAPTSVQKIEPKVFFANERTYLHWLHAGVTLYSIAAGILAFSETDSSDTWAIWYAMALLPISLGFCMYALHVFLWRADRIKSRVPGRWDDPRGPILLGSTVVGVLVVNLVAKLVEIYRYNRSMGSGEL